MLKTCLYCNSEFETADKRRKFCSLHCSAPYNALRQNRVAPTWRVEKTCPHCAMTFVPLSSKNRYCSRKCGNAVRADRGHEKMRVSLTAYHASRQSFLTKRCPQCQTEFQVRDRSRWRSRRFCSQACLKEHPSYREARSAAGRKAAQSRPRRSAQEIELYQLCERHFENVSHNQPLAEGWDADICLHDHKCAILWNGIWHREQLAIKNHSLMQVQTRDRIKKAVLEKYGWTVLVFEDDEYTPETAFAQILEVLEGTDPSSFPL